jgi:hypothetical protein
LYNPTLEEDKELKAQGNIGPCIANCRRPGDARLRILKNQPRGYYFTGKRRGGERVARYSLIGNEPFKTAFTYGKTTSTPIRSLDGDATFKVVNIDGMPRSAGSGRNLSYDASAASKNCHPLQPTTSKFRNHSLCGGYPAGIRQMPTHLLRS